MAQRRIWMRWLVLAILLLSLQSTFSQSLPPDAENPEVGIPKTEEYSPEMLEEIRSAIEAPDGTVCLNRCSGHGTCADYTCTCDPGFSGDDCSFDVIVGVQYTRHGLKAIDNGEALPSRLIAATMGTKGHVTPAIASALREEANSVSSTSTELVKVDPSTRADIIAAANWAERMIAPRLHALSVGDGTIETLAELHAAVKKYPKLLLGISSGSCHRCVIVESAYASLRETLANDTVRGSRSVDNGKPLPKYHFLRINADVAKSVVSYLDVRESPSLLVYSRSSKSRNTGQFVMYRGSQTSVLPMYKFLIKLENSESSSKGIINLKSWSDYENLLGSARELSQDSMSTTVVIGVFESPHGVEEDEFEDFEEIVAKKFARVEDVYVGVIGTKSLAKRCIEEKLIHRTPAVLVIRPDGSHFSRMLNDDESSSRTNKGSTAGGGVVEWITRMALPRVGKITGQNFDSYARLGLPMLLMFLDLSDEHMVSDWNPVGNPHAATSSLRLVGGRSGGVLNALLLTELEKVAIEFEGKIVFGYLNGLEHEDQMRSLGLFGGREDLPSLAFNTKDRRQVTFPNNLPINFDTLVQFTAEFISGKLQSQEDANAMAARALARIVPLDSKNKIERSTGESNTSAFQEQQGVMERFGDGRVGDNFIVHVTEDTFQSLVVDEDEADVLLYLHNPNSPICAGYNVYFKRMAARLHTLLEEQQQKRRIVIAALDITKFTPPADWNLLRSSVPVMALLPASSEPKKPPFPVYTGVSKVQEMIRWVGSHLPHLELPTLPHLTEADRVLYKEQVREREKSLVGQLLQDAADMAKEDAAREKYSKGNSPLNSEETIDDLLEELLAKESAQAIRQMTEQQLNEKSNLNEEL